MTRHDSRNRSIACGVPGQRFGATLRNPSGAAAYPAGPTTKPTSLSDPSRSHRGRQHPLQIRPGGRAAIGFLPTAQSWERRCCGHVPGSWRVPFYFGRCHRSQVSGRPVWMAYRCWSSTVRGPPPSVRRWCSTGRTVDPRWCDSDPQRAQHRPAIGDRRVMVFGWPNG